MHFVEVATNTATNAGFSGTGHASYANHASTVFNAKLDSHPAFPSVIYEKHDFLGLITGVNSADPWASMRLGGS